MITINTFELYTLLSWIRGRMFFLKDNNFKKNILLMDVYEHYKTREYTEISVEDFEDIILQCLSFYDTLKDVNIKVLLSKNSLLSESLSEIMKDEIIKISQFIETVDKILISFDFLSQEINDKKIEILQKTLDDLIFEERYEECQIISDKLKDLVS